MSVAEHSPILCGEFHRVTALRVGSEFDDVPGVNRESRKPAFRIEVLSLVDAVLLSPDQTFL